MDGHHQAESIDPAGQSLVGRCVPGFVPAGLVVNGLSASQHAWWTLGEWIRLQLPVHDRAAPPVRRELAEPRRCRPRSAASTPTKLVVTSGRGIVDVVTEATDSDLRECARAVLQLYATADGQFRVQQEGQVKFQATFPIARVCCARRSPAARPSWPPVSWASFVTPRS
jgi:hypothetical protein